METDVNLQLELLNKVLIAVGFLALVVCCFIGKDTVESVSTQQAITRKSRVQMRFEELKHLFTLSGLHLAN